AADGEPVEQRGAEKQNCAEEGEEDAAVKPVVDQVTSLAAGVRDARLGRAVHLVQPRLPGAAGEQGVGGIDQRIHLAHEVLVLFDVERLCRDGGGRGGG